MQTKVIIFDFDGTLTISKSSTWVRIWEKVNALDIDEQLYKMYASGKIDYNTWLEMGFNEFKKRGYTESDLNELVENMVLIPDLEQTFQILTNKGIKLYILSGGLKIVIERKLKELAKYVQNIEASSFIFDSNGNLSGFVSPLCNPENKQEYVNYVLKSEKIKPEELLFVGNGKNDETVYITGVNTLCLNPDGANYDNKEIWHNVVETNTLKDILPFISC